MAHAGSFSFGQHRLSDGANPTLGISTGSVMHSKDADKSDDAGNQGARKPELGVLRGGGGDADASESALAREFAQRALAPLVSDLRGRHGRFEPRRIAGALAITPQQLAECLEVSLDA